MLPASASSASSKQDQCRLCSVASARPVRADQTRPPRAGRLQHAKTGRHDRLFHTINPPHVQYLVPLESPVLMLRYSESPVRIDS